MLGFLLNGRTLLGIGIMLAIVGGCWRVYERGYSNGQANVQKVLDAAVAEAGTRRNELLDRLAKAGDEIARIEAGSAIRIAEAQGQTIIQVKTITKVIENEPIYAAVVRPAAVVRVRNDQTARLIDAAGRGAELSGASVPGLPGAGP